MSGNRGVVIRDTRSSRKLAMGFACVLLALPLAASAVTISGHVTLNGARAADIQIAGAKATCSAVDVGGNYSCNVASGWNGTIAAFSPGYTFQPQASYSYSGLNSDATGADFTAVPASGVRAEFSVYRPSSGLYFVDYDYNYQADLLKPFGGSGDIPVVGDRNGDGLTDYGLYRNGTWYINYNQTDQHGGADEQLNWGGAVNDVPLLADIDGDGKVEPIVFRDGLWYVFPSGLRYILGGAGDIPVAGDFNGDGVVDLGVFRNGVWYIATKRTTSIQGGTEALAADLIIAFGGAGDLPVAFDYDGDGRADLGLFRNGVWYVSTRLDGIANVLFAFGAPGDRPGAGLFNPANTLFVKAGSGCSASCTQTNPYGSVFAAWEDATDGQVIRIAAGTYPERLGLTNPGNQYAPGKFGKNNVKLIGVSRNSTIIAPPSGDAIELQGSTGYVLRNLRLQSQAAGARGLVLSGGTGSYVPMFPGAQVNVAQTDIVENDGPDVLLTGTANAWFRYTRVNRSKQDSGMLMYDYAYARFVAGEASGNGYNLALPAWPGSPPAGRGFDVRADGEADVRRTLIDFNRSFGVIGTERAKVSLIQDTIEQNTYNGVIFCGPSPNDQTQSLLLQNWIAGNGTFDPNGDLFLNGVELYLTCAGTHQLSNNTFVSNTGNGLFVGSGTVSVTNNTFRNNKVGITLYADDANSSTDTHATLYGNLFQGNRVQGLWAERAVGTTTRQIVATVGGASTLQNTFRDQLGSGVWAISCPAPPGNPPTTLFACPAGGNVFINNSGNIAPTCPATCTQ